MELEQLAAFKAVASERSFSRASERLFKTQPAISQSVRGLEDELGQRLFLRLGRTTELTEAGRALLEQVDQVFDALVRAKARVEALGELKAGTLRISTSDTTACYVLPPVLRQFRDRYPGIEVSISNKPSPITVKQVVAREADLGLVTLPVRHPRLASEAVARREDVAICAPGHPLAKRKNLAIADLAEYPLLLLDRGSNTRSFIDRQFELSGRPVRVTMELGSIEVIKRLVELNFGVSIVPAIAVREEVAKRALTALRVFRKEEARVLGVVCLKGGPDAPAAREFLRILKHVLAETDSSVS